MLTSTHYSPTADITPNAIPQFRTKANRHELRGNPPEPPNGIIVCRAATSAWDGWRLRQAVENTVNQHVPNYVQILKSVGKCRVLVPPRRPRARMGVCDAPEIEMGAHRKSRTRCKSSCCSPVIAQTMVWSSGETDIPRMIRERPLVSGRLPRVRVGPEAIG
jgi:hypothetical protein